MKLRYLPLLLMPLAAFAASTPQTYTCDDGSRLAIAFSHDSEERPSAILQTASGPQALPMVPAAAGARYRAGPLRLAVQDEQVIFEDESGGVRRCTLGETAVAPRAAAAESTPAASNDSFVQLAGSVTYRNRQALPSGAILSIRIRDRTRSGTRPLVEQAYELDGAQVPIPFSANVDRDLLGRRSTLSASARIDYRGRALFVSDREYPLFERGQPKNAEILLKPARPGKTR